MAHTVCGNCGSSQGPFERVHAGTHKSYRLIVVCAAGKPALDKEGQPSYHMAGTLACLARRDKQDAERWGTVTALLIPQEA